MFAEIAVDAPVYKTFHYHIPPELEGSLEPGHLVQVAFGAALQHGIILALLSDSPIEQTKPVLARLDPEPVVSGEQIALARWLSRRWLAPIGSCLWLMLPPGLTGGRDIRVTLLNPDATSDDPVEARVLDLLRRRGPLTGRQLNAAKPLHGQHWRPAVDALEKAGVVRQERVLLPASARPRVIQTAALALHPDQIAHVARKLGRESRQAAIIEVLAAMRLPQPTVAQVLEAADAGRAALKQLVDAGFVTLHADQRPPRVSLNLPLAQVDSVLIELREAGRDLAILRALAEAGGELEVRDLAARTGAKPADLTRLADLGLIILGEQHAWRDSLAGRAFIPTGAPALTLDQQAAWSVIAEAIDAAARPVGVETLEDEPRAAAFLLHGVTGSGKTEIYLRAIERTLARGRSAIYCVPEIALTAQTIRRAAARFPGRVAVIHSGLSDGERYDTWRRARTGLVGLVVGARSALFAPLPDIGLIVLDEEHDASYKQSPPVSPPYYHAREVAEALARLHGGVLLLGSATPALETMYRAERGELRRLTLPTRILGHREHILVQARQARVAPRYRPADAADALTIDLPPVQVVDMREELKAGNTRIFSRALHDALAETLSRREQAILFINRRGQATYVFCRDCGYVAVCPRCGTPLTYHRYGEALRCHQCGYQQPQPRACPQCASPRIRFFGAGTQQVEAALLEVFPTARSLRWDADTAADPMMHEAFLAQFIEGKADVLVGTQMIAKGLDLPLVTLVGVVSADVGLNLPDFRAAERTFQVLTQVAGRAGRGLLGGRVILQTYQPDHYAIAAAARHDFAGFYAREMAYRRALGYPPFRRLARIVFRCPSEAQARAEAERAAAFVRARLDKLNLSGLELIGPAPCFFQRVADSFRWHLLLRGPNPALALEGIEVTRGWHIDLDPADVL